MSDEVVAALAKPPQASAGAVAAAGGAALEPSANHEPVGPWGTDDSTPLAGAVRLEALSPTARSPVAAKRSLFRARTAEERAAEATSRARDALAEAAHKIEPFKLDGSLLRQGAVGELQWIPGDNDAQGMTSKQGLQDVTDAFVWVSGLVPLKIGMHAPLMQWLERWWSMEALRKSRLLVPPSSPARVATPGGYGVFRTPGSSVSPNAIVGITRMEAVDDDASSEHGSVPGEDATSPTMWDRAAQRVQEKRKLQKLRAEQVAQSPRPSSATARPMGAQPDRTHDQQEGIPEQETPVPLKPSERPIDVHRRTVEFDAEIKTVIDGAIEAAVDGLACDPLMQVDLR